MRFSFCTGRKCKDISWLLLIELSTQVHMNHILWQLLDTSYKIWLSAVHASHKHNEHQVSREMCMRDSIWGFPRVNPVMKFSDFKFLGWQSGKMKSTRGMLVDWRLQTLNHSAIHFVFPMPAQGLKWKSDSSDPSSDWVEPHKNVHCDSFWLGNQNLMLKHDQDKCTSTSHYNSHAL